MIDYSRVMKPHTEYEWEKEKNKQFIEELSRKQEDDEARAFEKNKEKEAREKEKQEKFLERFTKHPVPDEALETLKLIKPSLYGNIQLVYILDNRLEIIAVVGKSKISNWIFENGYGDKKLGRRIVLEHLQNKVPYDGKVYFVPFEEYEEFMRSKKVSQM